MKNLAEQFLSSTDRQQIEQAVAAVEKQTSGEVVCMVVSSSYHYPTASIIATTVITLPLALISAHFLGGWMWIGTQNMWLFMGVFAILFALLFWLLKLFPSLQRLFVSQREMDEEVEEAAISAFFKNGLYRTRDANGVLLFFSVFEHKVWLLADKGIHEKVSPGEWDQLIDRVTQGIVKGRHVDAICRAVGDIGDLLTAHFPVKADDTNELKNLIVGDS